MGAAARAQEKHEGARAPAGKLTFYCSGNAGCAVAGAARVQQRVSPPAKGRFLVVLSASSAFRGALRKELPRPLGRNRVILDASPRRARSEASAGEVDLNRLAERAWFYRRLGATHLVVECDLPRGTDLRAYLISLIVAFAPLAADEGLHIDLVVPGQAAHILKNEWLCSYLLESAAERAGREIVAGLLRVEEVSNEGFSLDGSEPAGEELALRPSLQGAAGASRPREGQLGLL